MEEAAIRSAGETATQEAGISGRPLRVYADGYASAMMNAYYGYYQLESC